MYCCQREKQPDMKSFGACNSNCIWVSTSQVMRQLHSATTDSEKRRRSINAQMNEGAYSLKLGERMKQFQTKNFELKMESN